MQLCQEHALQVWVQVGTLVEGGEVEAPKAVKPKERPESGWIYYLRVGDRIKIGYAGDVRQRMRSYPPHAELIAVHRGTLDDEKRIHASLTLHLADGREWYGPTPEFLAKLDALLAEHPGAVAEAAFHAKPPPPPEPKSAMRVKNRMRVDRRRIVR